MPGFFYEPVDRKTFFKASGVLTATALVSRAFAANQETDESDQTRIALLSDTHIPADVNESYRGFRPAENLRVVVEQVAESAPAAALKSTCQFLMQPAHALLFWIRCSM